jgi:hypothetical protein
MRFIAFYLMMSVILCNVKNTMCDINFSAEFSLTFNGFFSDCDFKMSNLKMEFVPGSNLTLTDVAFFVSGTTGKYVGDLHAKNSPMHLAYLRKERDQRLELKRRKEQDNKQALAKKQKIEDEKKRLDEEAHRLAKQAERKLNSPWE